MQSIVYVVIVTYNGMKWLPGCLDSLFASEHIPEIIIVDNNSSDASVEYIREHKNVNLICSKVNLGFAEANNIGMEIAYKEGADFVFLVNQDTILFHDTIPRLLQLHLNNSEYGILSPIQLNKEHEVESIFAKQCFKHPLPEQLIGDCLNDKLRPVYKVSFANAAFWFISRKCLKLVGGFSPAFKHYAEDNNYVDRCHYHGLKIGIAPSIRAIHDRTYNLNNRHHDFGKVLRNLYNIGVCRISNVNLNVLNGCGLALIDPLREVRSVKSVLAYPIAIMKIAVHLNKILRIRRASMSLEHAFLLKEQRFF